MLPSAGQGASMAMENAIALEDYRRFGEYPELLAAVVLEDNGGGRGPLPAHLVLDP
jgi:hypothetical protein